MSKVELVYFKNFGKYYSQGSFESQDHYWNVVDKVKKMKINKELPGLVKGHSDFSVVMTYEGVPYLIV